MLAKLKFDFLNILSLALWPQSHSCRLALAWQPQHCPTAEGKTHDPASPQPPHSPSTANKQDKAAQDSALHQDHLALVEQSPSLSAR